MSFTGLAPPPFFLATPGRPSLPWEQWKHMFNVYLLASGAAEFKPERRKAILLRCLEAEGQRIYQTLYAGTSAAAPADNKPVTALPDEYDTALATLQHQFSASCNVIVERHRFHRRSQHTSESVHECGHINLVVGGAGKKRLFRHALKTDLLRKVNYSNHLDYSAWNNHQRKEATSPVFKVTGQFMCYPNLFTRTHEFFENSWIYFPDTADKIYTGSDGTPYSPNNRFFWLGWTGGATSEGVDFAQHLVILHEAEVRNIKVTVLAQGSEYKLSPS
ncbi:hypothetical protein HPB50_002139 [Hyalomma asiaticum]|uniref:Uncharacterized protein n=1 Tax=Hyalomma asiaticum TaxID=266040 RepID=A0ACB7RNW5_HYAAI|nr:hypothetical protein HPB50_002139 [Hyalomma asiaticum]